MIDIIKKLLSIRDNIPHIETVKVGVWKVKMKINKKSGDIQLDISNTDSGEEKKVIIKNGMIEGKNPFIVWRSNLNTTLERKILEEIIWSDWEIEHEIRDGDRINSWLGRNNCPGKLVKNLIMIIGEDLLNYVQGEEIPESKVEIERFLSWYVRSRRISDHISLEDVNYLTVLSPR